MLANRILASDDVGVLADARARQLSQPQRSQPVLHRPEPGGGAGYARDIYESNLNGTMVAPFGVPDGSDPYSERFIDAEIYKARPDVMAIVTAETPEFVAFSVSSVPVHGANAPAIVDVTTFSGGQGGLVSTPALGASLAQALGRRNSLLLRGRGAVITAATINGVVGAANGLRESMRTQLTAAALGGTTPTWTSSLARRARSRRPRAAARGRTRAADPTAGDRPWNYWKYLANAELARENRQPAPGAPPAASETATAR